MPIPPWCPMRDRALTLNEKVLALGTKNAVAAIGLIELEPHVGISRSQLSRCCSIDNVDSITIRDAAIVDSLGDGGLHILRALAKVLGCVVVPLPEGPDDPTGLQQSAMTLTVELGDVVASIRDALHGDGECDGVEAQRALRELDQLDTASAAIRVMLHRIVEDTNRISENK